MKTKIHILLFVCCITFVLCLAGCTSKTSVKWKSMHGTLFAADWSVEDSFSFPVTGYISNDQDHQYLSLKVDLPESIPYRMSIAEPNGDPVDAGILEREGDYFAEVFCYDVISNAPTNMIWAINTEKQYFIAYWGEDYGRYLVASVDPDVKPVDIFKHFDYFMDIPCPLPGGQTAGNSELDMKKAYIEQRCRNGSVTVDELEIDSYGTYRGCTVAYVNGPFAYTQALENERVGPYVFHYGDSQKMLAYKNGDWVSMKTAYVLGWLDDTEVEQILEKHKVGRDHLYNDH